MNINVIAKRQGYFGLKRRYEGDHFQMKLKDFVKKADILKPDGKEFFVVDGIEYHVPSWVEVVLPGDTPKKAKASKVRFEAEVQNDDVI